MLKAMVFIDSTWLYHNIPRIRTYAGREDYYIDFSKIAAAVADEVAAKSGKQVDVVRTFLFGSYPVNYDQADDDMAKKREEFFSVLKEEHHMDVVTFPTDFKGQRIRRSGSEEGLPIGEKCVDIALASHMLYYAAVPGTYDVAIVVIGDEDFKPALQLVRRLGKRVAIASIHGSCANCYIIADDGEAVRDYDVVWINDILPRVELLPETRIVNCESPDHVGERAIETTFRPKPGQKFYCRDCRARYKRKLQKPAENDSKSA